MLDLPHGVEADAVGELDLLERVLDQPVLGVLAPRAGQLVLVEDAEAHGAVSLLVAAFAAGRPPGLGSGARPPPRPQESACPAPLGPCPWPRWSPCRWPPAAGGRAARHRRAGRAVALRPRAQGLRRDRAQHDLEGLVHGRRRRPQRRLLPDQRQHQRRDAAVRRHRRLDVHRPADARHDVHGPGARRPRADAAASPRRPRAGATRSSPTT